MNRSLCVVAIWIVLGCIVCAGDDTHRKAAEQLLSVTGLEKSYSQMTAQLVQELMRQKPHLAEFHGVFREFLDKHLAWSDVKAELTDCYVQEFSEAELRKLVEFYNTPTGQKALAVLPQLAERGRKITEKRLAGKDGELNRMLFLATMKKAPVKEAASNNATSIKR